MALRESKEAFFVQATIADKPCIALFDSGCTGMILSPDFVKNHPSLKPDSDKHLPPASLADGSSIPITAYCDNVNVDTGPTSSKHRFYVARIKHEVIFGLPWITYHNAQVDWDTRVMYTRTGSIPESMKKYPDLNSIRIQLVGDEQRILTDNLPYVPDQAEEKPPTIPKNDHPCAQALLQRYAELIRKELPDQLPPRRPYDPVLELKHDAELKNRPIYRMSQTEVTALREILDKLIAREQIYECNAAFASPAFLIKKKSSGYRLLVDMRQLNDAIKDMSWPIPDILSLLDKSRGCTVWSSLDMVSGYQQMRIAPESEELTAFRCPLGVFAWRTLPQGCKISPPAFCRMMHSVFGDLPFACVYLDDLLVCSRNEAEHEEHLRIVFDRMKKNSLYASLEKTYLFRNKIDYLGYSLCPEGVTTDPKKIAAIKEWPTPKSRKHVQSLLGAFGYYRRFVSNYSQIATPLTRLTSKDVEFRWTTDCETAFKNLKDALCSAPVLRPYDPDLPTFVVTDASNFAVGAVLEQEHPDGRHPVEFVSQKLITSQQKYPVHAKELYAIVVALQRWRHYLHGKYFIIETDHHPLKYIKTQPKLSMVQVRWLDTLNEYSFDIRYKPGKENNIADGLSRRSDLEVNTISIPEVDPEIFSLITLGYEHDSYFTPVVECLANPDKPIPKDLVTKCKRFELDDKGLLYFIQDGTRRLAIPNYRKLREKLMGENHDVRAMGHLGTDKTYARLQQYFYWPRMYKQIDYYVATCDTCQRVKARTHLQNGLLYPHAVPPYPFHTVAMDLIVELPKTKNNNDAIVVFICKLSKYAYLVPTTTRASGEDIARSYFNTVCTHHGLPSVLVSDRDTRFTSDFWKKLHNFFGSRLNFTTTYRPSSDGESERRNRTVEQVIRALTNYNQTNWDELLPIVQFAINSSKQDATRQSAMCTVTGHEPRLPSAALNPDKEGTGNNSVDNFILHHQNIIKEARDALTQAQDAMASYANRFRRDMIVDVGDRLMVRASHLISDYDRARSKKLAHEWYGPYTVIKKVSNVAIKLRLPTNWPFHNVFHVSQLKHYNDRTDTPSQEYPTPPAPAERQVITDEDIYKVLDNRIVRRGRGTSTEYLIQLRGQQEREARWYNEKELENAPSVFPDELGLIRIAPEECWQSSNQGNLTKPTDWLTYDSDGEPSLETIKYDFWNSKDLASEHSRSARHRLSLEGPCELSALHGQHNNRLQPENSRSCSQPAVAKQPLSDDAIQVLNKLKKQ